jgi:hypothetical protein
MYGERGEDSSKVLKFEPASLEATPRRGSSKVEINELNELS